MNFFPPQPEGALAEALRKSATVHQCFNLGRSLEETILTLVKQQEDILERLVQQQYLLPKKYKTTDGKVYVCHAPDELIPLTEL